MEDAQTTVKRGRRKLIETYVLMAAGAAVILWAWLGDHPIAQDFWMSVSGMLALFYGESLLTTRSAKIAEAEAILTE